MTRHTPLLTKDSTSSLQYTDTSAEFSLKMDGDEGEFTGYAARFNNIDQGGDKIVNGAFDASIKKRGAGGIKLLNQHRPGEPIGIIKSIESNNKGLKISGKLLLSIEKGREVYEMMKAGILDAMSIGYSMGPRDFSYDGDVRVLKKVDVREISVVTFPMNESARITRVKSDELREADFIKFFEDHGILEGQDAIVAAKAAVEALQKPDADDDALEWVALSRLSQAINPNVKGQ